MVLIRLAAVLTMILTAGGCANQSGWQQVDKGNGARTASRAEYPDDPGSNYADKMHQGKVPDSDIPKPKQLPSEIKSDPKMPVVPDKTQ